MKINILCFLKIIFIVLLFVNNSETVYSQVVEINTIGLSPPIDYVWVKSATSDPWDLVTLKVPPSGFFVFIPSGKYSFYTCSKASTKPS